MSSRITEMLYAGNNFCGQEMLMSDYANWLICCKILHIISHINPCGEAARVFLLLNFTNWLARDSCFLPHTPFIFLEQPSDWCSKENSLVTVVLLSVKKEISPFLHFSCLYKPHKLWRYQTESGVIGERSWKKTPSKVLYCFTWRMLTRSQRFLCLDFKIIKENFSWEEPSILIIWRELNVPSIQ